MNSPNVRIFDFIPQLLLTAREAGAVVMKAFHAGLSVSYKSDKSPVTEADVAAEELILRALGDIMPGVPVVAEETVAAGQVPNLNDDAFFLVDPIDGTKGFARGDPDFTVNIALVSRHRPVFGLLYAPALDECYVTVAPDRAVFFKLAYADASPVIDLSHAQLLTGQTSRSPQQRTAIVSRSSSAKAEYQAFFTRHTITDVIRMSSSLKFGVLAAGGADIYPRFGPTSEWDIAAGHAILQAAGGSVTDVDGGPFLYGKLENKFANPHFVAWRRQLP